jgi:hypothetical protein
LSQLYATDFLNGLLAEVAARNPTSDPGIKDWIEDNRAYFEEQVGRKP